MKTAASSPDTERNALKRAAAAAAAQLVENDMVVLSNGRSMLAP